MTADATLSKRISYDEYRSQPDEGRRYELIDGKLFAWGPPSLPHQLVSGELTSLFYHAVWERKLGRVFTALLEVRLTGDDAVQPDLIVVLRDRAHVLTEPRIDGAPSLVVEITSPETYTHDINTKFTLYARNGILEYWIVDPDAETITVHELRDGQYVAQPSNSTLRSLVVANLVVDVLALFEAARFPFD